MAQSSGNASDVPDGFRVEAAGFRIGSDTQLTFNRGGQANPPVDFESLSVPTNTTRFYVEGFWRPWRRHQERRRDRHHPPGALCRQHSRFLRWSYGAYMSSLCITKGASVFKAAIAVAPVTNWRYYDSIYTERYMGLPKDHANGYDDNSPINHVDKLRGKYLLVHGLADDNVHFQNSAEMVTALVKANKKFDFMAYPDKNHGIYGGTTRMHLFEKITDFVLENL